MLVRAQTALLGRARTSVAIATEIGIGIAQNTGVMLLNDLFHLRCQSLGIHGSAGSGSDTRRIFVDRALPSQHLRQ